MLAILLSLMFPINAHPAFGYHIYPQCGIVREIGNETIVAYDTADRPIVIPMEDTEDWQEGDIVSCIMWYNGTTETVYDDVVLSYKYSGFIRR